MIRRLGEGGGGEGRRGGLSRPGDVAIQGVR